MSRPEPGLTITCAEVVELVTDYLEGALPRRVVEAVERHLESCPHCTEYLQQMRRTIDLSGHLREEDVPVDLVDALTRAFAELRSRGSGP